MTPKFRISNIVPSMAEGVVVAWYIWDNGEIESHKIPIQNATFEGLMSLGFERQIWWEAREAELNRIKAEALAAEISVEGE